MANTEPDKICVCNDSDCGPRGASRLMDRLKTFFGVEPGTRNSEVDLDFRGCTGYCSLGPNVAVNGNVVNHLTPETVVEKVQEARTLPHSQGFISDIDIERFLKNDL